MIGTKPSEPCSDERVITEKYTLDAYARKKEGERKRVYIGVTPAVFQLLFIPKSLSPSSAEKSYNIQLLSHRPNNTSSPIIRMQFSTIATTVAMLVASSAPAALAAPSQAEVVERQTPVGTCGSQFGAPINTFPIGGSCSGSGYACDPGCTDIVSLGVEKIT